MTAYCRSQADAVRQCYVILPACGHLDELDNSNKTSLLDTMRLLTLEIIVAELVKRGSACAHELCLFGMQHGRLIEARDCFGQQQPRCPVAFVLLFLPFCASRLLIHSLFRSPLRRGIVLLLLMPYFGGQGGITMMADASHSLIRNVWADNLEKEMALIRNIVDHYPFIAMDTEFPGVVARPIGGFKNTTDFQYQTLRCNVDLLNIIQLGFTFADESGRFPAGPCTWQFHFKFSLNEDMYAQESIDLLTKSGIDFKRHEMHGIVPRDFGDLLTSSGIVLCPDVKWISFHSGYDFGYLLKVLTCDFLPVSELDFFDLLYLYFPTIYDIKYLMKSCKNLKGGLQDVADDLGVARIGPQHQAGSDALLTAASFFQLRKSFFDDKIDDTKYAGQLYGLASYYQNFNQNAGQSSLLLVPTTVPLSSSSQFSSVMLADDASLRTSDDDESSARQESQQGSAKT